MKELDFEGLANYLLGRSMEVITRLLPNGKLRGNEYVCGDLDGGEGDSMRVNTNTGLWAEFNGNEKGGDLISLYAAKNRIGNGEAAKRLAIEYNYDLMKNIAPKKGTSAINVMAPPPEDNSMPNFELTNGNKLTATWEYKDSDGYRLFYVSRYDGPDGKSFMPRCYIGKGQWAAKAWPAPRPLYGLELLKQYPDKPILIVEGEKAADAARLICGHNYVVVTWPNGAKAWAKADWSVLFGRENILICSDADKSGMEAAQGIASLLYGHVGQIKIIDPKDMPAGWDLADNPEWTWKYFVDWARKRLSVFEIQTVIPEIVKPPEAAIIDNSKNLTLNVQVGESDPPPAPSVSTKWVQYGLALTDGRVPVCNINNTIKILNNDPLFNKTIWYDDFHKRIFWTNEKGKTREWRDVDTINLASYMQDVLAMRRLSDEMVYKAVVSYAEKNMRNEPLEWLSSLAWDKKPRLDGFFPNFMGVESTDYTRAAGKNFWISMVARVLRPGVKADNMIILEGKQGRFKSTALNAIGGKFYTECHESVMSKDFYLVLQGKFLIEVSELDAFSRVESNTIKKVVSNQTDRFRTPYGRLAEDYPRQCVFVGTTNDDLYLRDHTGGRRFWPIKIGRIDIKKIEAERDQLFAEAVFRFKADEDWYYMPEEEAEEVQESRRQRDEWEDVVADYVAGQNEVSLKQIALEVLHIEIAKLDIGIQRRIGRILTSLYYSRRNVRHGESVLKRWIKIPPQEDMFE